MTNLALRNRSDRRTLGLIGVTLFSTVGVLFYRGNLPLELLLWGLLQTSLAYLANVVNHNHIHCPVFRARPANRAFEFALSIALGHPVKLMIVPHMMNHHAKSGTPEDWCDPSQAGRGWGVIRLLRYTWVVSVRTECERKLAGAPKLSWEARRELLQEAGVILLYSAVALWIHWRIFLLLNLLPWSLAILGITAVNLLQHDGCPGGEVRSRDFVGRVGNWLMLNNGYHTAHHMSPSAHWSELPQMHRRMVETRNPVSEPSALGFLIKNYLLKT